LYLDEFQNYTTDNIKDILSESRKYALSLTLVHQYLDQLTGDLQSAVLNTAGSIISFRVGYQDGNRLAKEIFSNSDFKSSNMRGIKLSGSSFLPSIDLNNHKGDSSWDDYSQAITKLQQREFWFKRRGVQPPAKYKTLNMPLPELTVEVRKRIYSLINTSGRFYSRLKKDVQEEVSNARSSQNGDNNSQLPPEDDFPSFWGV
jgi:hypothetical protein